MSNYQPYESPQPVVEENRRGDTRILGGNIPPQLVEALRDGSHGAYREVYIHYRKPLYNFLYALTKSQAEAEDIVQDVFIGLWERRASLDPSKNIRAYLYTVARNAAIQTIRRRTSRENYLTHRTDPATEEIPSDQILIARETQLLIELALQHMPRLRREVFRLSREEGLSNDEIARQLSMNKQTVASHLSSARKELREVVELFLLLFMV